MLLLLAYVHSNPLSTYSFVKQSKSELLEKNDNALEYQILVKFYKCLLFEVAVLDESECTKDPGTILTQQLAGTKKCSKGTWYLSRMCLEKQGHHLLLE